MHPALVRTQHRPWPMPKRRWTWRQSWLDLLFAHWPLELELARRLVPEPLELDTYDGQTYVGLVPFRMSGVMRRPWPDLPWLSAFPEVNVRLYVSLDGKPGVWFLSLDAPNPLAVWAAQNLFHLPYYRADIDFARAGERFDYRCRRRDAGPELAMSYGPTGEAYEARAGTLEHWLTERYCLYAKSPSGAVYCCDVQHVPWPLQPASASIEQCSLFTPHGFECEGPPSLLHFSPGVDVVMWNPDRVR